jgi:hypothetical protein
VTRRLAPAVNALLSLAVVVGAATPALAQPSVLLMHSQSGDYIGGGGNWLLTPFDGTFSAQRNFDNGVEVRVENFPTLWWHLNFTAPGDVPLVPGTYPMATRFPFQASGEAGLDVSGDGRGCNMLTGRFTVLEVVYGAGTTITSFAANFEQHCEGQSPALFGSIRYNAAPRAPYTVSVSTAGSGSGTITSFPAGLDCGATCATAVADGLVAALVATPAPGSGFAGWSGSADCADGVISDAASVACTATFVTCTYAVSPTSLSGVAGGGFGQLNVTATPGCPWTPTRSDDWIFVDTTTRTGSQPLGYSYVPRGPYSTPRVATVTIAGATFTLTQPGLSPEFYVNPGPVQVGPAASTFPIPVASNVIDVAWTASSNTSWLSVGAGGIGNASVLVSVEANPTGAPRLGTVVVAGVVVTVEQQPNGPPGAPSNFAVAVNAHVGRFTWTPSPFGSADSYRIEAGASPGTTLVTVPAPALGSDFTMPGIPAGRFFVRLRGVNQFGVGPPTEDVELVVGANGTSLPTPPRTFTTFLSNGILQAQWQPAGVPGEALSGFVLEAGLATGSTVVALPLGLTTFTTIANVPPGAFFLRLRAVNSAGIGAPSQEQLIVSPGVAAPPGAPSGLVADVVGSTVSLRWDPGAPGGMATRYRLEAGPSRGATALVFDTLLATTNLGFTGVPPGRYYVRVRGVNAQGLGPATADIRVDVR